MKCCDMTAGALRHKVNIQREVVTPDGIGGRTITWHTIASPRCLLQPVRANESYRQGRLEHYITHKIILRYRSTFSTADRIEYNGRLMQIRGIVNVDERNMWMELAVEEGRPT